MNDKLKLLLTQINIKNEYIKDFENGELEKIICNRSKDKYVFCLNLTQALPLHTYLEFNKLLKERFNTVENVTSKIKVKNYNIENITDYYRHYLENYSQEAPLLQEFISSPISLDENILTVEISNKAEEMKFNSIKAHLQKALITSGFNIKITTKINEQEAQEIREEIEKEKLTVIPKTVLKENPNIMGREIKNEITPINMVTFEIDNVTVEAKIFDMDIFESSKSNFKIITLKLTDGTDSMYCKIFCKEDEDFQKYTKALKVGNYYKIRGYAKNDKYSGEIVLNARDINISDKKDIQRKDEAPRKRIELHAHTKMSQMDGVADEEQLVETAMNFGHKAIAITDHNGCQAFPHVFNLVTRYNKGKKEEDKFKALYGTELTLIDDSVDIVLRKTDQSLLDTTYVVFDLETTGFNAGGADSIIEIGAVKISNGEIIDRFDELINPGRKLPAKITEVTNITDEMLKDKDTEANAVKRFITWTGDLPMVAHNAKFDVSFLVMAHNKYNLGEFKNTVIDTLELSRALDTGFARHSLSALVKRYDVPWDENAHHRGDYDAEGTALVFHKMLKKLVSRNFQKISDLDRLVSKDEIYKYGTAYHVNLIVKNKKGLKNLFKIISLANTKYLYKTPRILRSEITKYRDGILVGSGCYESEIFRLARSKSDEELVNLINFYDYVEVQPPEVYDHLIQMHDFGNKAELIEHIKKIIRVTKEAGKIIVATGDVHHINPEDRIYREIIVNQKVPGGGRHPLAKKDITKIPSQHLRTTEEMLQDFAFLPKEEAEEIVIDNPEKIANMVDFVEVIIDTGGIPFAPKIENSIGQTLDLVYTKAESIYGKPLPYNIEERLATELYGEEPLTVIKTLYEKDQNYEKNVYAHLHKVMIAGDEAVRNLLKENILKNGTPEDIDKEIDSKLTGIIGAHFDVIYLIAQKLVKKSNDDGYLVGSRGSVGSSLVATMMGITEVNSLPPHYVCPKCKHSIFEKNGRSLGSDYGSGYDLPDLNCPNCGTKMNKEGQDMPFATFLGFHADKVPDIDLNFSDLNQASAHEYTKVLFGVDNVYRAGTIGTVADKTAFGYVKGYCEDKGVSMRTAEVERLAKGCTGVKRTTGQHPGGIVVIPGYMDVYDFTPFQYPADDITSAWRTTHFDYHAIDQDVLKLDILGHSGPTKLRLIQNITGDDVTKVPLDDKETMKIFLSPEPLGVTKEQIMNDTGTLGIPEFGTPFTLQMVKETKPKTFAELVKISGLSHGTDVWNGNAKDLIDQGIVPFSEVIGCRDDIMVYLMYNGLEPITAFKIMEFVRKGRATKAKKADDPQTWAEYKQIMKDANIPEWFINSCQKIKYMFPKAHAVAYVINAFRIAYYKVHKPSVYYAAQFSAEYDDFDIEAMIKGYDAVKAKIIQINEKGYDATNKESSILECLKVALEALARNVKFKPVNLYKSDYRDFTLDDDGVSLIPPFRAIDGLGDVVAKKIVEEREKGEYISIEDLQKRAKISSTLIEKMRSMGILDGMEESSQLSLF